MYCGKPVQVCLCFTNSSGSSNQAGQDIQYDDMKYIEFFEFNELVIVKICNILMSIGRSVRV